MVWNKCCITSIYYLTPQCFVPCAEQQVYLQCIVLSLFAYNMNGYGDAFLILVLVWRYWNGLHVHVKTFVLSQLLHFLFNINFCWEFLWTPWVSTLNSQLLYCDLMEEMHNTNTVIIDIGIYLFSLLRFSFIHVCNSSTFLCTTGWSLKCLWFWMLSHIWSVCRHL